MTKKELIEFIQDVYDRIRNLDDRLMRFQSETYRRLAQLEGHIRTLNNHNSNGKLHLTLALGLLSILATLVGGFWAIFKYMK